MNYYEILGVRENSNTGEIKKAYRVLAKKYHPDVSADDSSSEDFLLIHKAYQILSDPVARKQYDRDLHQTTRRKSWTAPQKDVFTSSLFDWLFNEQFLHVGLFKHRRRLGVEIILTPEEARIGGIYILSPLVQITCPSCHGLCHHTPVDCFECHGTGTIEQHLHVPHHIPSGVYDGMLEYISLERFGFPDVEVEILYTVSHNPFL
jgi:molecular chaperone DnaJ